MSHIRLNVKNYHQHVSALIDIEMAYQSQSEEDIQELKAKTIHEGMLCIEGLHSEHKSRLMRSQGAIYFSQLHIRFDYSAIIFFLSSFVCLVFSAICNVPFL